ncbi:hypothetical protein L3556_03955 [Candidatus Synechococcus calcipolaris G9]|uniref:DUF91 domain-containing protein n=1 Tax=Candidatus Synechococcus calcipolaris G9 TaxID=1497997 RepID=A0ABT6EWD4_9SYNE|nr:hypothetical protein [Candidatus Synechococcus calcipolaris]MDG2990091.1 hypothetical protein [Candidatus Synechococcus calcipolaris G9]
MLQQIVERKINEIIDGLESLVLSAKELRLKKSGDTTTRIDLFGNSEYIGLAIIELKKSGQTERQAFTELLAYANHFCSIFSGLTEHAINTILIAPMKTRTVRDAFVQEVLGNNKSSVALIPSDEEGQIKLTVYYPDESYYQWFENNLLDDRSMYTVAIAFQELDGCIDTDKNNNQRIPDYSKEALNTISNSISHRLGFEGFHSIVYATQSWGEISQDFLYPNVIYAVFVNPFASFRNSCYEGQICGETREGRVYEIQSVYDQIDESERQFWLESLESNFHGLAIRIVKEEFDKCFLNTKKSKVKYEISLPDWYDVKTSMINSVFTHNLEIYQTGLLRKIYSNYIAYIYGVSMDEIFYSDDLPIYSYYTLRSSLPVWEILRGLGVGHEHT